VLAIGGAASAQDKTTIVFSHAFGDENRQGWVQDVADAYMAEHPDVQIELRVASSYRDNLNNALLGAEQGDAPHIVQVFEVGTQLALDSGVFIPVSSVASEEQLATLADIIQPVLNYYTVADDVWSLPWNSSSPILYYNKEMFEAAGIMDVPTTFSEVEAACEILMNADLGLQACIGWPLHSWMVEQWMSESNALLANNDNGRSGRATETYLDSEAMLTIFDWWKNLADKGWYTYTGQLEDWNGSDAIFTGQQVAMHITSTADLLNIAAAGEEAGFTVGAGMLPIPDGVERNGVVIGGASIWLSGGHPDAELEAAVDFMLFLGDTENMVSWHKATGYYPIRTSSIDALEAEDWFTNEPRWAVAFNQLTETKVNYASGGALLGTFLETRTIIEQAAQSVIDGGEAPADALGNAKAQADQALADYNDLVME
jgi:sn-glycerol 3-phosphate transport system substrate-binding protein